MVKNPLANAGDVGSVPGSGRFLGGENSIQHSCLENPMDRGVWPATVHGVAESDTTEHPCTLTQQGNTQSISRYHKF